MRNGKNGVAKVIVNISSTQGVACDPAEVAYEASKHALEGMSGVLAAEVHPLGIRTVVVNLGSFRTGFALGDSSGAGSVDPEFQKQDAEGEDGDNPYRDLAHPVRKRIDACLKFAKMPEAARGDPRKGARVLFDVVMKREGSKADEALGKQREAIETGKGGSASKIERLILGSDALPKIERQSRWFDMQVESCRAVSSEADADGVKPIGG